MADDLSPAKAHLDLLYVYVHSRVRSCPEGTLAQAIATRHAMPHLSHPTPTGQVAESSGGGTLLAAYAA